MAIEAGTLVEATTASGETVLLRALGAPKQGMDFPVVWVCDEREFRAPDEGQVKGIPWPLDAIKEAAQGARTDS